MKRSELAEVVGALTLGQGREFDQEESTFWLEMLRDLDGPAAKRAVMSLLKETSAFITPAMIRDRVAGEALQRLRAVGDDHAVPAGMSQREYIIFLKEWRHRIISGFTVEEAEQAAFAAVGKAEERRMSRGLTVTLPNAKRATVEIEAAEQKSLPEQPTADRSG